MSLRRRLSTVLIAVVVATAGLAVVPTAQLPSASAAPPAPVILNSGGLNWVESQSLDDDGAGRRITVTFLVQHPQGRRINGLAIDSDWNSSNTTNSVGVTNVSSQFYGSGSTNFLETSRVTYTFDPGRPGGFGCSLNPFGGNRTRRQDLPLRFRVVDNTGERSASVTQNVHAVEDDNCLGAQDYPVLESFSQTATSAVPGESVVFTFTCDDADGAGSSDDDCDKAGYRWRRLNDGATGGSGLLTGINDNSSRTIAMSFPSRGRYVVETRLGNEDDNNMDDDHSDAWWRLGAVDVNDGAATLDPSLSISGSEVVAGSPPSVNQSETASVVLGGSDGGAGTIQVAEWDGDGNGSYERREYTVPSSSTSTPSLILVERTQAVDTSTHGVKTIGVRVLDNGALDAADSIRRTATTSAQIRVNAIPTAMNFSADTAEDTTTSFNLIGADADSQPAPLTYTVGGGPTSGDLNCIGASCTYTPDPNFNGTDSFTYQVADGPVAGAAWATSNTATVTIDVTPVNDAPVADGQQLTTNEDTPLPITLSGSDLDGDSLAFDMVSGPTHGEVTGTGATRTYTPDPNFHGTDSFIFAATDPGSLSGTATVTITVDPVNDNPVAIDQALNTDEDTTLALSLVAADVDGDNLAFTADQPASGSIACIGTACTYTPSQNFNGSDSFTFHVDDGNGGTDTGEITITVAPVNDAPMAVAQLVELDEDMPIDITLEADDVDLDPLSFTVITGPDHGTTMAIGGPVVNYAPDLDFHGADEFTFEAHDGGLSDSALVALTINPVNDTPVINAQAFATDEDTPKILSIAASDVDGDSLSWSNSAPAYGTLVGELPDVAYVPDTDFAGTDTFTVTVDDGNGGQASAMVTVTVSPVNDGPVAAATTVTTDEDMPIDLDLSASDVDNAASELTYTVLSGPSQGTLHCPVGGPSCTYTPDPDVNGADLVIFEVSDGALTDTASVSITISPVNDPPVPQDIMVATDEDEPVGISLSASDVDGNALTFDVSSPPSSGAVTGDPPTLLYTPNLNANGADSFQFTVGDGTTEVAGTVTVVVDPVNDPPVAQPVSAGTPEDTAVSFTLAATDVDDDPGDLMFSVSDPPGTSTVDCGGPSGADCVFTPASDFHGAVQFTYEVSDGDLGSSNVVTIAVASENDPPTIGDQVVQTDEDSPVTIDVTGADPDGDTLTYSVTSQPGTGSLSGTAPHLLYTPASNWTGSDTFAVTVSDGELTATATITVDVAGVNDAPVAQPLAVDVGEDETRIFQLEASDIDGDPLTFAVETGPDHGAVTCDASGACAYTPDPDYHGPDAFTFAATDASGASDTGTVTLVVHAAPMIHTTLSASQVLLTLEPIFRAKLTRTDTGEPLAGRTVRFVAGESQRCTAVTDANGWAQCGAPLLDLLALINFGYDAHFDGDPDFVDSHGHGPLLRIRGLFSLF